MQKKEAIGIKPAHVQHSKFEDYKEEILCGYFIITYLIQLSYTVISTSVNTEQLKRLSQHVYRKQLLFLKLLHIHMHPIVERNIQLLAICLIFHYNILLTVKTHAYTKGCVRLFKNQDCEISPQDMLSAGPQFVAKGSHCCIYHSTKDWGKTQIEVVLVPSPETDLYFPPEKPLSIRILVTIK